ncbi:MAG: MBL fold metallo-hydrolase [Clostridia bacterium]|nr:MBL fold metallo-hydrolase [Clostridia bacterium]
MDNYNEIGVITEKLNIASTGHITNVYILYRKDSKEAILIDPAYDANELMRILDSNNLTLKYIIITHCHADHIAALADLLEIVPECEVVIHKEDFTNINEEQVNCKDIVKVDLKKVSINNVILIDKNVSMNLCGINLDLICTPGHTKGSIVVYEKDLNVLFTGDTIFSDTYGRTDLKTGSHQDMKNTLDYLFEKFDDVKCLPGHGEQFNLKDVKRKIRLLFAYKG